MGWAGGLAAPAAGRPQRELAGRSASWPDRGWPGGLAQRGAG
ncbi:hypothetical protein [Nucisporomicrobium flavum]|nr:hypothetical protein [Nucisporomicrobium flavum]